MKRILLIFLFLILTTSSSFAQKKNTIMVEPAYLFGWAQVRGVYYRDFFLPKNTYGPEYVISTFVGLGTGNGEGNDIVRDLEYLTLGVTPGIRFFNYHRVEAGLQYYYTRYSEGYLSITDEDPRDYDSSLHFILGYRFEDETLVLKIFVEPYLITKENRYQDSSGSMLFIGGGLGFGFRF